MIDWVQPLIQLVTAGGFGALLWYILVKYIPRRDDLHREERTEWLAYIKNRDDKYDELVIKFIHLENEFKNELKDIREALQKLQREKT